MKYAVLISIIFLAGIFSCNQSANNSQLLQTRIDSLAQKLAGTYKPGLGEFMSEIQVHHAKLWFAAQNQNWKLADFEMNEIKEALSGIKKYCTDRPETKDIVMIDQPMDSISNAIQQKNRILFKNSYILLTNKCNSCHQATSHEFNVITIPKNAPFSNQEFKVNK